jgi:hypothetical protein
MPRKTQDSNLLGTNALVLARFHDYLPGENMARMAAQKTLADILPSGTEGGKEFARVVDHLLISDAARRGSKFTPVDDSAGDYAGLDSFGGDAYRVEGTTGFQYKFYSSPFSANHRSEIIAALKKASERRTSTKLTKWILVVPTDLIESGRKKGGGDITWFEGLRKTHNIKFEIEYWGHSKLQSLFLECPLVCLKYYPELVEKGKTRNKSILEIKQQYNKNLIRQNAEIQFVGMSNYKADATAGVSLEHIYIPLSLVPEGSEQLDALGRTSPKNLLKRGQKTVVLGDPGSGKSTLLKFLALSGIHKPLQKKYKTSSDERISIIISLREYAEELKKNSNYSLKNFILENTKSKYSLDYFDSEFLEFYFENGETILLFDGLDELQNSQLKSSVRDKIDALSMNYPSNTIVITSRIVGYDMNVAFRRNEYTHFVLAKLLPSEMKSFIDDWYKFKTSNQIEREKNAKALMRVLESKENSSIRELAENPLLLTILTLVHRIDADLPDERHVLYLKCTETLLNTWPKFKRVGHSEAPARSREEKKNKRRVEEIAFWMHTRGQNNQAGSRAVISFDDLRIFLTNHISQAEGAPQDAEDQALVFLEFIKKEAGLLIEIGDKKYSFVHLTFQEYLSASCIRVRGEKDGVQKIKEIIIPHLAESNWHEVLRLLVASLESEDTKEDIVNHILDMSKADINLHVARLLAGFYLDGISAAGSKFDEIISYLIREIFSPSSSSELHLSLSIIRQIGEKEPLSGDRILTAIMGFSNEDSDLPVKKAMLCCCIDHDHHVSKKCFESCHISKNSDPVELLSSTLVENFGKQAIRPIGFILKNYLTNYYCRVNPGLNLMGSLSIPLLSLIPGEDFEKYLFEFYVDLISRHYPGPLGHFFNYWVLVHTAKAGDDFEWLSKKNNFDKVPSIVWTESKKKKIKKVFKSEFGNVFLAMSYVRRKFKKSPPLESILSKKISDPTYSMFMARSNNQIGVLSQDPPNFSNALRANTQLMGSIARLWCDLFDLKPDVFWCEALTSSIIEKLILRFEIFGEAYWEGILKRELQSEIDHIRLANAIFSASWLEHRRSERKKSNPILKALIKKAESSTSPYVKLANIIRRIEGADFEAVSELDAIAVSGAGEIWEILKSSGWDNKESDMDNEIGIKKQSGRQKRAPTIEEARLPGIE